MKMSFNQSNKYLKSALLLAFLSVLLSSCFLEHNPKQDDEILARVYQKYLFKSDLKDLVPKGTGFKDSITMVKNYINNWVRNQLLLQKSESNLIPEQKDFKKQLENYRNSLIIYQYESNLVKQNLDTLVTDEEIETYYENNQKNFELKENILIAHYVILPVESLKKNPVKTLLLSDKQEDLDELDDYCKQNAISYYFDNQWITFNELIKVIPIETYNQQTFLEENAYIELENENLKYFLRIMDYKIRESTSPLSFEWENIKKIIINKRKLELLENMHREIYDDALTNNHFEIY